MARPKTYHINLTDEELNIIKTALRKKQTTKTVRNRCQILLDLDEAHGKVLTHEQSAKSNAVCLATITNTVKLYSEKGINGIISLQRSINSDNAGRKPDGRAEARLIEIACSPPPEGHAHWTLRLLEEQAKVVLETPVGKNAIGRALKKNRLRPHKNDYRCIPSKEDAEFVACMEDVPDVYELPYNPGRPVVCMDEKPYQLLGDAGEPLPMRPGDNAKIDSEYIRNGTCSIFAFVEPPGGTHHVSVHEHRKATGRAMEIKYLSDVMFPPAEAGRIIRRLEIHYTPKHGSRLDMAEIELNVMTRQCLSGRIETIGLLRRELSAWEEERNKSKAGIKWHFQTGDAREKLISLYPNLTAN